MGRMGQVKYILVFSFIYKHYTKSFDIKLYSDNTMLDDISLTDDINYRTVDNTQSKKYKGIKQFNWWYSKLRDKAQELPEKIFVYEVDESVLGNKIKIKIADDGSNSTNGFMTKSNMFMIDKLFLFPKFLFESHGKLRKLGDMLWRNPKFIQHTEAGADPIDRDNDNAVEWPGTDAVLENGNLTSATWHGGVKQLDVPLIKKFNTYFLHPCKKNMRDGRPIKWNFDPSIFEYDETFNILQNVKTRPPQYSSNVKVVSL